MLILKYYNELIKIAEEILMYISGHPISIELVLKNLIFARIFFMILSLHILLSNFLIKIFQEYQKDWNTKEKDSPLFYIFSFW